MPKKPTKPALWEAVKREARTTSEGTPPGQWSSRKAAIAQLEYKKRGGDWKEGPS